MSTMTIKITISRTGISAGKTFNILGSNLTIDFGDGTTATQEENTDSINASHSFSTIGEQSGKSWTITVTGNITGLGDNCLYQGSYVTEITLPEGLKTIGDNCLCYIEPEEIIIPSTVTSIGTQFLNNSSVKKVKFLTTKLTSIGQRFLYNNQKVISLELPEGLQTMGYYTCYNCISMKHLTVPSTLTSFPIVNSFTNIQLETMRMGGGPISNPPSAEKIIIPLKQLQNFLNHNSYPNDESRYDFYGTNIAEGVYIAGKHMADKLMEMGVNASPDDGLTTLADKILDIEGISNHNELVTLRFNDNNNSKGLRPAQVPFKLCIDNTIITGCLLPKDNNHPAPAMTGYPTGTCYMESIPNTDQNGNILSYEWQTYQAPDKYVIQKIGNNNDFLFNGLFEHTIKLQITDENSQTIPSEDIVYINVQMNANYNPEGTSKALTKSDFTLIDGYYTAKVIGFDYQLSSQLWSVVTIGIDPTKYLQPPVQTLSVTKSSSGDTVASKTIIAPPVIQKDTYIESNMRSSGSNARMFYGYLLDENDNPVDNKTITITYDDFGGGSITATTGKCGYFQTSQGGAPGMGAAVNTVTVTISFDGDSQYNSCTKTMTISTADDINIIKRPAIYGNVDNNVLTITKITLLDITDMTYTDMDEWTVKLYDEEDQYITSLTDQNNTYTAPSTPYTVNVVYDEDCANGIINNQRTFTIGEET